MNRDALAARLRGLFLTELEDHLRTFNTDLLALEVEPRNAERLGSVFRIVHTLKGAAHAAAVPQAEHVCHALETMLVQARGGKLVLGADEFVQLFAAADALADAGERLKAGHDLTDSPLAALQHMGYEVKTGPPPARPALPPREVTPVVPSGAQDPAKPQVDPLDPWVTPATPATPAGEKGVERVRVEVEKLDALLATAGELLVTTGRVAARPAELDTLHELATRCSIGWRRAAHRVRHLGQAEEARGPTWDAFEEVERNLKSMVEESGRIAAAVRGDARALSQVAGTVGDRVRRLRLRPFSDACVALPRALRDLAAVSGKEVRLEIVGGEVEADRAVLDVLQEVLLHLVRNAVDHGIETADERERTGKSRAGTVTIAAALDRQRLQVSVTDDGRGLDLAAIRAQLVRGGLDVPEGDRELVDIVFNPGFSTHAEPTNISGRGVGLDAVRTTVERIRGSVQVTWTKGAGTTFALECPPSLATMRAVLVAIGSQILAIPSAHVEQLLQIRPEEVRLAEGRQVILTAESPIPIVSLARLLGPPLPEPPRADRLSIVRLRVGGRRLAVAVDRLLSEEEIVVRPVERLREPPAYLGGAALLGTGKVALVLNAASLVSAGLEGTATGLGLEESRSVVPTRRRILVVDDSITTRALEQSILEAEGFEVLTALDGAEGWRLLQEHPFDLVVSDVEMPRMNGFELCKAIRGSRRFAELPIILVTAQEAAEHRELGLEAGADAYLPKSSFDQQSLLDAIQQLLG